MTLRGEKSQSTSVVSTILHTLREELPPMLRLAGPVVLAELGWMAMGIVDTMMVGRVSAAAIGGVGIGSALFHTVAVFGLGLLLGLDTLVSQAFGAGDLEDCHRSLLSGVHLTLPLTPLLMGVLWAAAWLLPAFDVRPEVVREAVPYLYAVTWSVFPQLLFFALRRYLQSMNLVVPTMVALLTANLVNAGANWVLIFGHWGFPALGAAGAGWATCTSRTYMALLLLGYVIWYDRRQHVRLEHVSWQPDWRRLRDLIRLGFFAAMQLTGEVGVFAAAATLLGKLDKESLAAHQIVLNMAGFSFMVPLGVSSAAAVRVGQAVGRDDPERAGRAGWTALLLGAAFMSLAGLCFWLLPERIMRLFTSEAPVIERGIPLLFVAALFQLFDGLQVVATGALRGAGDTRTPMLTHLGAYWALGLPVGYALCFWGGWGARGMWVGFCVALVLAGAVLSTAWFRRVRELSRASLSSEVSLRP
jgi:MATE family multidrug resistance protein